jgi:hypothetical protein
VADSYDFQIDTLKFRLAERKDLPYVRSTAPFRKEQFDTSSTVGDQSLTGWWTRGQLSFHMGAGLKYYEVLEGEEVLNRFEESEHVKVFEPGEVTLDALPINMELHADFSGIAVVSEQWPDDIVALDQFGWAFYYTSSSATPSKVVANDTTGFRYITSLGEDWFGTTNGKKVEAFYQNAYIQTSYSHTLNLYHIWGGKNRLWIVDESGQVYVKAAYPAAPPVALASPVCTINNINVTAVSFTDGGGSVFMSAGRNEIYAFTPANDGSVAALTAPVTVARLPENEDIACIQAHMGILTIATSRGVRFALIDADALTVGPLVVEWSDSSAHKIGILGSSVFVTGETPITSTICYEFDLSNPIPGTLKFPYRLAWFGTQTSFVSGSWTGAAQLGFGMVFWGGDNTFHTNQYFERTTIGGMLEPTGYVKTAYHRFGTLDPKRFYKVTVRAKDTGTIQVYKVDADGTETSLGTMNAADEVGTFAIGGSSAVERMAFKFVLNRDSGNTTAGPTFLGYQVKALPVPDRQELLRVPLVIADFVALRHGTRVGTQGKGYSDLMALKALENDAAIVTYTDHRTGETGTAYIESLEFQDTQPATHNDNGFGGFAYVTLRVLE